MRMPSFSKLVHFVSNPITGVIITAGVFILAIWDMGNVYRTGQTFSFVGLLALMVLIVLSWFFSDSNWKGALMLVVINIVAAVCLLCSLHPLAVVAVLMLFLTVPHFRYYWGSS